MERQNFSAFYTEGYPTESVQGRGKQLEVLDLLQRYDLLPSTVIRDHIKENNCDAYGEKLLTKLSKGHYIRLPDELLRLKPKPRGSTYLYQLGDRGKALLEDKKLWLDRHRLSDAHPHKVLRCLTQYALDHPPEGMRFISERDILSDERCPPETRALKNPSHFKLGAHEVQPDGPVFGYERNNVFIFFQGFEADNGHEDIEETAANRRSGKPTIEKKLRNYTAYLDRALHQKLYGLGNVYVPFVFKAGLENRMRTIIKLLARRYPTHQRRFLFTCYTPDLANATWSTTAGPFNIIDKLKGGEKHGPQIDPHTRVD